MIYGFVLGGFGVAAVLFVGAAWGSAWILAQLIVVQEGDEDE